MKESVAAVVDVGAAAESKCMDAAAWNTEGDLSLAGHADSITSSRPRDSLTPFTAWITPSWRFHSEVDLPGADSPTTRRPEIAETDHVTSPADVPDGECITKQLLAALIPLRLSV